MFCSLPCRMRFLFQMARHCEIIETKVVGIDMCKPRETLQTSHGRASLSLVIVEVALMLWPFAGKPIMDLVQGLSAYAVKKAQSDTASNPLVIDHRDH